MAERYVLRDKQTGGLSAYLPGLGWEADTERFELVKFDDPNYDINVSDKIRERIDSGWVKPDIELMISDEDRARLGVEPELPPELRKNIVPGAVAGYSTQNIPLIAKPKAPRARRNKSRG